MSRFGLRAATTNNPILAFVEQERVRQGMSRAALSRRVGLAPNTMFFWTQRSCDAGVFKVDCTLRALGYKLAVVPLEHPDTVLKDD